MTDIEKPFKTTGRVRWWNDGMSLHDGDIAELAREAVDQKDPKLEIHIDPLGQNDPYRLGAEAWTVTAAGRTELHQGDDDLGRGARRSSPRISCT